MLMSLQLSRLLNTVGGRNRDDILIYVLTSQPDNLSIFPDFLPAYELGPNTDIYPILPTHFQIGVALPDCVRLGIVCMALNHQINRTRKNSQSNALLPTFFRFRGLLIRSLNDMLSVEQGRMSNYSLVGITTLLIADVS